MSDDGQKNGNGENWDIIDEGLIDTGQPSAPVAVAVIEGLTFAQAIEEIRMGKKLRRVSWPTKDYIVRSSGRLMIRLESDKLHHPLEVSDGDLDGEDWAVVED